MRRKLKVVSLRMKRSLRESSDQLPDSLELEQHSVRVACCLQPALVQPSGAKGSQYSTLASLQTPILQVSFAELRMSVTPYILPWNHLPEPPTNAAHY